MRWPWQRRRPKGRHELGAAVTAIPSYAAPVVPMPSEPAVQVPAASPPVAEPAVAKPAVAAPAASPPVAGPPAPVLVPVDETVGFRVELGFRDGSTAALAAGSPQARALEELASALTQRNESPAP